MVPRSYSTDEIKDFGARVLTEEIMIGEDKLIKLSGAAAGEACTVVLRGSTMQMIDEAECSLHNALSVLSQTVKVTWIVLCGKCSEMLMSCAVEEEAHKIKGKNRGIRARAEANTDNPCRQCHDSSDLVTRLRAAHYERWTRVDILWAAPRRREAV